MGAFPLEKARNNPCLARSANHSSGSSGRKLPEAASRASVAEPHDIIARPQLCPGRSLRSSASTSNLLSPTEWPTAYNLLLLRIASYLSKQYRIAFSCMTPGQSVQSLHGTGFSDPPSFHRLHENRCYSSVFRFQIVNLYSRNMVQKEQPMDVTTNNSPNSAPLLESPRSSASSTRRTGSRPRASP